MNGMPPHFSLAELVHSDTANALGLDNTPTPDVVAALARLAQTVLEPLRAVVVAPLVVHVGYRSPGVNAAVGGVADSQHCLGQAADLSSDGTTLAGLFGFAWGARASIPFDQVILESGCVHVSGAPPDRAARGMFLVRAGAPGAWTYQPYTGAAL